MYQAYLFDWDGTLADTLPIWFAAYHEMFMHENVAITQREIGQKVIGNFEFRHDFDLKDEKYINAKFGEVYEQLKAGVQLNSGAEEMLLGLKRRGAKLALVTSTDRAGVEKTLNQTRIINLFSAIITAEDTLKHKPDPEPLQLAIAQMGVEASATAMVGDTYKDMYPAKELGISCILYHNEIHKTYYDMDEQIKQYPPDHIVTNLADILEI